MKFKVVGNIIVSGTLNTNVFKIVEKIPSGFYVWNIGENMGSDEYIPLCQDLYPEIKDDFRKTTDEDGDGQAKIYNSLNSSYVKFIQSFFLF